MGDVDDIELTEYQRRVVDSPYKRQILIGGRRIGKTECVVRRAKRAIDNGLTVAAPTHLHRRATMLTDRLVEHTLEESNETYRTTQAHVSNSETDGRFDAIPVNMKEDDVEYDELIVRRLGGHHPDLFVVDEAHYLPEKLLFMLEREWDADVLLTGTPRLQRGIVDIWAENSPYWQTEHATMYDMPEVNTEYIRELEKKWSDEQVALEIYGKYTSEERP